MKRAIWHAPTSSPRALPASVISIVLPPVLINAVDDRDSIVQANARMAVAERLRLNAEWDALRSGYMSVPEFPATARTALARGGDL